MNHPAEYFAIPPEYSRHLGIRWSDGRDALEHTAESPSVGLTFAMNEEVSRFLAGLHSVRPPMAFAHVVHLMKLAGLGAGEGQLASAFGQAGRPLKNVGALCGVLSRHVPRIPDPPDVSDLNDFPRRPWLPATRGESSHPPERVHEPSLTPMELEARIARALSAMDDATIEHWLQFGAAPVDPVGDQMADEVAANRPKSLLDALDEASQRPRLVEARALIANLDAALSLPPRTRPATSLPIGGYADVSTRGSFDAILPSQLALDNLEFLRRFAARELLYYQREEPRASEDEELALVLDQGVRTWGEPRLILAAAALALSRRAAARGSSLVIATSGGGIFRHDPELATDLDADALGQILEASDFSRHPAYALARVFDLPARGRSRDVIVLTHPRALLEPIMLGAAVGLAANDRLFAATVDDQGEIKFSELRPGGAVAISCCRVTIPIPEHSVSEPIATKAWPALWRGDVEKIPFPFPIGVVHPLLDRLMAFDHHGDHLLASAGPLGMLHVWNLVTGASEILPRALLEGQTLSAIEGVIGVRSGFAVAGFGQGDRLFLAHYDFEQRTCIAHDLGPAPGLPGPHRLRRIELRYDPSSHVVVILNIAQPGSKCSAVDLSVMAPSGGACVRAHESSGPSTRAAMFAAERSEDLPNASLRVVPRDCLVPPPGDYVQLDAETGRLTVRIDRRSLVLSLRSDGELALPLGQILAAKRVKDSLILLCNHSRDIRAIVVFDAASGASLGAYTALSTEVDFAVSSDGQKFAIRAGRRRLEVFDIGKSSPRLSTEIGRVHDRVGGGLEASRLLIGAGSTHHVISWDSEALVIHRVAGDLPHIRSSIDINGDPKRFTAIHRWGGLQAAFDVLGQVAVAHNDGTLVAMFHVFRGRVSAWMPDGTRIRPTDPGGPRPAREVLVRIADALRAASDRSIWGGPL